MKEVYSLAVIVEAQNENDARRLVLEGKGEYQHELEFQGVLNPKNWEVLEL